MPNGESSSLHQVLLKSEDYGKHLLGVQDLLQKHTLSEADITTQRERARALEAQVQKFVEEMHPESAKIVQKSGELDAACQRLQSLSVTRLAWLKVRKRDTYTLLVVLSSAFDFLTFKYSYLLFLPPPLFLLFCYPFLFRSPSFYLLSLSFSSSSCPLPNPLLLTHSLYPLPSSHPPSSISCPLSLLLSISFPLAHYSSSLLPTPTLFPLASLSHSSLSCSLPLPAHSGYVLVPSGSPGWSGSAETLQTTSSPQDG